MSLLKRGRVEKVEEKTLITYIPPVDDPIKDKLHNLANRGFGAAVPTVITLEVLKSAISEWKQEKQIYSQEITLSNCTEISLSYKRILEISNLDNLVNLQTLRLDNNMIMKIDNLSKLKNIKWLDLSFNFITEMTGLEELENLLDLSLYNNQIKEISQGLDSCRRINVLSIGRNQILNIKETVDYLKKFSNLQALTVHVNPFCKDEFTVPISFEQNQKIPYFPNSYEYIVYSLEKLKYLDWKPIDEDYRSHIKNNFKNTSKDQTPNVNEFDEEKRLLEISALKNANAEAILNFYQQVKKKIIEETAGSLGWDKLMTVPGLDDRMKLLEKNINETIANYKVDILAIQVKKDEIIKLRRKEYEKNEEKFIEQSKCLVGEFKRKFKKFLTKLHVHIRLEEIESEIGLDALKNSLLDIEIYAKEKLMNFINAFRQEVMKINQEMQDRTLTLKEELDRHKATIKEQLSALVDEWSEKLGKYEEEMEKLEHGESPDNLEHKKNQKWDDLCVLFNDPDLSPDIEKITEALDDKINYLKETLDQARSIKTEEYFNSLKLNDFYRNKKRIEDINEIYDIYILKLQKELHNIGINEEIKK